MCIHRNGNDDRGVWSGVEDDACHKNYVLLMIFDCIKEDLERLIQRNNRNL